jgi:hypothetical protein
MALNYQQDQPIIEALLLYESVELSKENWFDFSQGAVVESLLCMFQGIYIVSIDLTHHLR